MEKAAAAVLVLATGRLVKRDVLILCRRPPGRDNSRVAQIWVLDTRILIFEVVPTLRARDLQNIPARLSLVRTLDIPSRHHLVYGEEIGLYSRQHILWIQ